MAGVAVKVDDAEFVAWLNQAMGRLSNPEPLLNILGATVQASIQRNFEEGGRPAKWAPHSKTTEKRRGTGARILTAQGFAGGLLGSISYQVDGESVSVGTNKIYAAVQQFGAKQGAFKSSPRPIPWGDIPARPFVLIQDEDYAEMRRAVGEYLGIGE